MQKSERIGKQHAKAEDPALKKPTPQKQQPKP
jgi:hypothetical protein